MLVKMFVKVINPSGPMILNMQSILYVSSIWMLDNWTIEPGLFNTVPYVLSLYCLCESLYCLCEQRRWYIHTHTPIFHIYEWTYIHIQVYFEKIHTHIRYVFNCSCTHTYEYMFKCTALAHPCLMLQIHHPPGSRTGAAHHRGGISPGACAGGVVLGQLLLSWSRARPAGATRAAGGQLGWYDEG